MQNGDSLSYSAEYGIAVRAVRTCVVQGVNLLVGDTIQFNGPGATEVAEQVVESGNCVFVGGPVMANPPPTNTVKPVARVLVKKTNILHAQRKIDLEA